MAKKIVALILLCIMVVSLVACQQQTPSTSTQTDTGSQPQTPAGGSQPQDTPSEAGKKFKIGYDIYWLGNSWSVMFAEEFKAAVQKPEYADKVDIVYTESEADVNKQINNIEDLIAQECDAIIITANSVTAISPVLKKAREQGIKVILNAVYVEDPEAYDALVYFDNYKIHLELTKWMAEKIGGKGKLIEILGIAGISANEDSKQARVDVLKDYPDIEVIAQLDGQWDYAVTKTAMANALPAYPEFDGILNQNGHGALGAIEAMEEANRPLVPIISEDNNGFMKKWVSILEKQEQGDPFYEKFDAIATSMPVYISVTALKVTLDLLEGKEVKFEENYTYPKAILEMGPGLISKDNMKDFVYPDLPDGISTVTTLSEDQLRAIFDQ